MADFDKIITSVPVNSQAAKQMGKGEAFEPKPQFSDIMPAGVEVRIPDRSMDANPEFMNFSGRQFGRLTVLGLAKAKNKDSSYRATWVCKCKCGNYVSRTAKSLKVADRGGNTFVDRCGECKYLEWITSPGYLAKVGR